MAALAPPLPDESSPWADLTAVADQPAPPAAVTRRRLAAVAVLLALGGALALGALVLVLKNRDGKEEARVAVPPRGTGKARPESAGAKPKAPPADLTPDRRAARWALSAGGWVTVRVAGQEQEVKSARQLPAGPFQLTQVHFWDNPQVADEEMVNLRGLTGLTRLGLGQTRVSDAGLAHLKNLTNLQRLHLFATPVSDAGLKHLAGLGNLRRLDLTGTRVTADGVAALRKALPKCDVVSGPAAK